MTLQCELCGQLFKSFLIVKEQALNDCSNKIVIHLKDSHETEFKKLVQDHLMLTGILVWYLAMFRFTRWNSGEEVFVEEKFRDWEKALALQFGLDVKPAVESLLEKGLIQ